MGEREREKSPFCVLSIKFDYNIGIFAAKMLIGNEQNDRVQKNKNVVIMIGSILGKKTRQHKAVLGKGGKNTECKSVSQRRANVHVQPGPRHTASPNLALWQLCRYL